MQAPRKKLSSSSWLYPIGLAFVLGVVLLPFPSVAQTNFALLSPDGAWCWFSDPRALFHNGELYFGYVRAADSKTVLSVLDPQSGKVTDLWTSSYSQRDDHDVPGLLSKEDGTMLAIYSRHLSDPYFYYRLANSTNPVSPADWNAEQTGPVSSDSMTYANPFQLSAESGKIYDFCRNLNYNPTVYTSTDGGVTWATPQILIKTGNNNVRPYVKYCSNYSNRIDFLYTDGHPAEVLTNSLYEMYYQNGAFYKSDGTFIKNYSNLPILKDSGEGGSVIYQYNTAPQSDPNLWIPGGRAWCWDIGYQTNGYPACVFSVQLLNATGSGQGYLSDRIYYYYARWTGTNWQKRFIAQAGRPLYSSQVDYAGGICLDAQAVNTIYISSDAANPFDLGSITNVPLGAHYEIYRGVTTDGGLTFTWQPITGNSTVDNLRPYVPRTRGGEPCVLWFRGAYSSYTSFSTEIVGLFTTRVPQTNGPVGTWIADADGFWSDTTNWAQGIIPDSAADTADFSELNVMSADRTVTLDSSRTVGGLKFGDLTGPWNWLINSSNGSTLMLGGTPSITVYQNTATLSVSLAGTRGFTKTGLGTLVLTASNSLSGTLYLDSGSTSANDGAVRITSSAALANIASPIIFRNNTGSDAVGSLQLDGSNGGITVTQEFYTSCRNNGTTPTYESLAGTNTLAGTNFVQVGGTNVIYQADAGSLLRVTAPIQYVGSYTATRTFTFTGDGDIIVSGAILKSANSANVNLLKSGTGTLRLDGDNTFTGTATVAAGTLGGTGVIPAPVTVEAGATLAPGGSSIGNLTINGNLTIAGNLAFDVNTSGMPSNDVATVSGSLQNAGTGTLTVRNSGPALVVGEKFSLFNKAVINGSALHVTGAGVRWANNLATDGSIAVSSIIPTTPTNITFSVSGATLSLAWPTAYLGWTLQTQTNASGVGLSTNWVDVPGSDTTNLMDVPIKAANDSVFYRLISP